MLWPGPGCVWLRYGNQVSQASDTTIQSVTKVGVTAFNMDNLGLKAVLKCVSKQMSNAITAEDQIINPEKKFKEKKKAKMFSLSLKCKQM